MWACGTLDRDSPIMEVINRCGGVANCSPFDVLKMTPLTDASRHLVISILSTNISRIIRATNKPTHLNLQTSTVVRFLHDCVIEVI